MTDNRTPQKIIYDCKSWQDYEMAHSKMNARDRGVLFEWLCVFYLQIAPMYRISYQSVLHSSQFPRQRRIKQILGLSKNREEGVDAIAERFDGKIPNIDPATGKPFECQGQNLKGWISKQRSRRDSLTVERVERLSAEPHWSWDPFDDAFKKNFEVLSSFQRETGNANPRQKEQYKGEK